MADRVKLMEKQSMPQSPLHATALDLSSRSHHSMLEKGSDNVIDDNEEDYFDDVRESQGQRDLVPGRYSFIDALGIVCGIIIGSGIFSSPGLALKRAGSPGLCLIAWAFAGGLVILTATCYMELGLMMPDAGGDFEYLRRAYGERASFAFAWFNFWISKTGSQAIIVTIFGRYVESILGDRVNMGTMYGGGETVFSKLVAVTCLVVITILNCVSVRESTMLQNILTACKLGLVVTLFIAAIVFVSNPSTSSYAEATLEQNLSVHHSMEGSNGVFAFGNALVACLWSFDGWADLNFMMEELKYPLSLPKIVATALVIVTCAYILCNIAYMMLLDQESMTSTKAIGTDFGIAMARGDPYAFWPIFIACGVALSTVGSAHGSCMTGGRAFYAVARGGKAPAFLAKLNKLGSPYGALLAQGGWGVVLLLLPGSSFSSLLDYFGPASWGFYTLGSISVILLRYKEPDTPRPFRIPLYPLPPVLVILIALSIIVSSLMSNPLYVLLAFSFCGLSIPCHMALFEEESTLYMLLSKLRKPRNGFV